MTSSASLVFGPFWLVPQYSIDHQLDGAVKATFEKRHRRALVDATRVAGGLEDLQKGCY